MREANTTRTSIRSSLNTRTEPKIALSGEVTRVIYGGDRSGRSLLLVKARDGSVFKLEGPVSVPATPGMRIQAEGTPVEHPKYGPQFKADLITEQIPIDRPGAVAFMSKTLTGVGKALASRLFDAFGERVYETIQNEPEALLAVQGMNREKLGPLLESWQAHSNVRLLWTHLAKYEIGGATAAKIYGKFGAQASSIALHRPYELTAVEGVGFATVDKIALASGMRPDSVARTIAAMRYALDTNKKRGSTACPRDVLVSQTLRLLALDHSPKVVGEPPKREDIGKAIDECVAREALKVIQVRGVPCVVTPAMERLETLIADHVHRIATHVANRNSDDNNTSTNHHTLIAQAQEAAKELGDQAQIEAVALPFKHSFSVITGGPGCGKTTVTKQITKVAESAGLRVVMMAPTGKAARRMAEVTGRPVETIHSTLQPDSGEFNSFKRNESNPLEGDLFIADESTMADAHVALALLRAIPDGGKVLFVGDVDQLPSVGPGAVMRDLIQSETVPVARLNTPHRTALNSDIVVNAHRIINGMSESVQTDGTHDFTFLDLDGDLGVEAILKRYCQMLSDYGRDGVQVLAPTYDGKMGVIALNTALQALVNPASLDRPEIEHHGTVFRLGDRVMQTSNNKQLNVVNGDVGTVVAVDMESKSLTVNFGIKEVVLKDKALMSLDLAYAITIHKSQGSEYPGVITVCSSSASFMLDRNLVYTAVTRAKKHSEIIGDLLAFKMAVRKPGSNRCTTLMNALRLRFGLKPAAVNTPLSRSASPIVEAQRKRVALRTSQSKSHSVHPLNSTSMAKIGTADGKDGPCTEHMKPKSIRPVGSHRESTSLGRSEQSSPPGSTKLTLFSRSSLNSEDEVHAAWADEEPSKEVLESEPYRPANATAPVSHTRAHQPR